MASTHYAWVNGVLTADVATDSTDSITNALKHLTDPTTNPTGGAILYVDASGNVQCRTSAGNVRLVAAV